MCDAGGFVVGGLFMTFIVPSCFVHDLWACFPKGKHHDYLRQASICGSLVVLVLLLPVDFALPPSNICSSLSASMLQLSPQWIVVSRFAPTLWARGLRRKPFQATDPNQG